MLWKSATHHYFVYVSDTCATLNLQMYHQICERVNCKMFALFLVLHGLHMIALHYAFRMAFMQRMNFSTRKNRLFDDFSLLKRF